jgi:hypothetical protein
MLPWVSAQLLEKTKISLLQLVPALSAARFSAAGVLALRFTPAVLKNTCAAAQCCRGSSKRQALQRCAAAVQECAAKSVKNA